MLGGSPRVVKKPVASAAAAAAACNAAADDGGSESSGPPNLVSDDSSDGQPGPAPESPDSSDSGAEGYITSKASCGHESVHYMWIAGIMRACRIASLDPSTLSGRQVNNIMMEYWAWQEKKKIPFGDPFDAQVFDTWMQENQATFLRSLAASLRTTPPPSHVLTPAEKKEEKKNEKKLRKHASSKWQVRCVRVVCLNIHH